jgi:hypothetical protein
MWCPCQEVWVQSATRTIVPTGDATFDLPITIPRGLAIDSTVQLAITARDRQFARSAQATMVGVIRKPKLCATGQLTIPSTTPSSRSCALRLRPAI